MASTKSYMMARRATATTNYRFLTTTDAAVKPSPMVEFAEADIWGGSTESRTPPRKPILVAITQSRKFDGGGGGGGEAVARSLPVNVPDWGKILREEHKEKWSAAEYGGCGGGGDEDEGEWVPPHEYLDRTRDVSFSVHEGVGRTLKGRDLSRVRNAIWERTGFQD